MNKTAIRVLFAAAVIALPVQLLVARFIDEPYPALFQPSFAGTPLVKGKLTKTIPTVTLELANGTSEVIPFTDVLPQSRLAPAVVFRAAFYDEKKATAPATVEWLRSNLTSDLPGQVVTTMTVVWNEITFDVADVSQQSVTLLKTVVVDLNEG